MGLRMSCGHTEFQKRVNMGPRCYYSRAQCMSSWMCLPHSPVNHMRNKFDRLPQSSSWRELMNNNNSLLHRHWLYFHLIFHQSLFILYSSDMWTCVYDSDNLISACWTTTNTFSIRNKQYCQLVTTFQPK